MLTSAIRRQYDEIIAPQYDFDPQSMIGDFLDRALEQIDRHDGARGAWKVFDVGVGTGRFLEKLRAGREVQPYGLDISQKMIDIACTRIPDLEVAVDDARNLNAHFPGLVFDLVCTHFITGFVPLGVLAPKVWGKLEEGGLWSYVGGTREGFPSLHRKANSRLIRWLFGSSELDVGALVHSPDDQADVEDKLVRNGFVVRACETFRPKAAFKDLKEFLEFAYYGGWLTPFVEQVGLHKAGQMVRAALNGLVFPMHDHHAIVVALAQKKERDHI
jgi:SAM-dependent methyltransferase